MTPLNRRQAWAADNKDAARPLPNWVQVGVEVGLFEFGPGDITRAVGEATITAVDGHTAALDNGGHLNSSLLGAAPGTLLIDDSSRERSTHVVPRTDDWYLQALANDAVAAWATNPTPAKAHAAVAAIGKWTEVNAAVAWRRDPIAAMAALQRFAGDEA